MTTESSGTILSPSPAAGVVLGSAPARIGEIVAFAPEARAGLKLGNFLSLRTRGSLPERSEETDISS
jgi:hypothetical protein